VTSIFDRQGHSPISYAVYKEKDAAARVLIEHVAMAEQCAIANTIQEEGSK